jgi:hypothetical protein
MPIIICSDCSTENDIGTLECIQCGNPLPQNFIEPEIAIEEDDNSEIVLTVTDKQLRGEYISSSIIYIIFVANLFILPYYKSIVMGCLIVIFLFCICTMKTYSLIKAKRLFNKYKSSKYYNEYRENS